MNNLGFNYSQAMNFYEKKIPCSIKKNYGIFYTDTTLANAMLKNLNIPKEYTIVDPCCGTGSFLFSAYSNGYKNIFGADIDNKSLSIGKRYIPSANFVQFDTLGNSHNELKKKLKLKEIDCIIGNPPYVVLNSKNTINTDKIFLDKINNSGKNLFIAALFRAFDLVKIGGIISYIIPKNFLHIDSYSNLRKYILMNKTIVDIIDIGQYFKDVRGEQIILTLKNEIPSKNHKIEFKKFINSQFINNIKIQQKFYNDRIIQFYSYDEERIFFKLQNNFSNLNYISNGAINRGKSKNIDAIKGKDIRKFGYKNIETPKTGNTVFVQNIYSSESGIIATFGGNLQASQTITVIPLKSYDMCKYLLGILQSMIYNFYLQNFCYNNSKLTMHCDYKYLNEVPLAITKDKKIFDKIVYYVEQLENEKYLSDKWYILYSNLNNLIYKIYELDSVDINFINIYMKNKLSNKWYKNDKQNK